MELSLIRSLMDKEFYDDHRGAKCPERIFSSDGKKIKKSIDEAMENYGRAVQPDEIEAIFMADNPSMTTAQKAMMSGQPVMAQSGKFISTAPTVGFGTNNQPSSGNFIKSALTSNNPSALGQVINYGLKGLSAKKDSDADSATAEANKKSRNKTVGPYSQTDMTKATGSEIGMASAGDVDEKDGLIFDGDNSGLVFKKSF